MPPRVKNLYTGAPASVRAIPITLSRGLKMSAVMRNNDITKMKMAGTIGYPGKRKDSGVDSRFRNLNIEDTIKIFIN